MQGLEVYRFRVCRVTGPTELDGLKRMLWDIPTLTFLFLCFNASRLETIIVANRSPPETHRN